MKCIVTAGPTYEPLDDVRRLTNFSTGRLGIELANFLAAHGYDVMLLAGEMATYHGERKAQAVATFTTTVDLRNKLKALSERPFEAIFHVAAVSDFAFGRVLQAASKKPIDGEKKISTRKGRLLVELTPTPKIIGDLRDWFPKAKIVGWKYEADGQRANAIAAGRKQIVANATDACVVNGPAYGNGFGLLTRKTESIHLAQPAELFNALNLFLQK